MTRDRNAGFAAAQAQVVGFNKNTGVDSRSYFAPGAKIFYVDPNNAQATDAGNLGQDPTVPLATVQAALALVRAYHGDTIVVGANDAWQYAPHVRPTAIQESLIVPWTAGGVRIVGASTNPLGVTWEAANADEFCISVYAMDVLIEGFCFTGNLTHACDGIYARWDGALLNGENLIVRDCVFDDGIDTAIQLEFSWFCRIYDNWFVDCDEYGIYTDAGGNGCGFSEIHRNWFTDCGIAAIALLGGANDNDIHHNHIYNSDAQTPVAATDEGITTAGGSRNLVHHNTLSCSLPAVPGGYADFCTAAATDAWAQNYCMDGPSVTNP